MTDHAPQSEKELMEQAGFIEGLQNRLRIDHLTGLNNRRALETELSVCVVRTPDQITHKKTCQESHTTA